MPTPDVIKKFRDEVERELQSNLLAFWLSRAPDEENGGFWGRIANDLTIDRQAEKSLILNTRILWTFSKAARVYGDPALLKMATRAYNYLLRHFWDPEFGGTFWLLDYRGQPLDTKKKIYGQAFTVYALSEYFLASRNNESLEKAIHVFRLIEEKSYDKRHHGYFETYNRDWTLAEDQRLSAVDMDEKKSMNTHLHVMEAYVNLLRAWKDAGLEKKLQDIIHLFLTRIINPQNHHFRLFFDEKWTSKSDHISFGHDIEGSWLLCEAVDVLAEKKLQPKVEKTAIQMAEAVLNEAVDLDGAILYEASPHGIIDADKHWWPQAEAVVGFLNACRLTGNQRFFFASRNCWTFIDNYLVDKNYGEWFWKVSRDGVPDSTKFKVDPWKDPYHGVRTCFEVMERLDKLLTDGKHK